MARPARNYKIGGLKLGACSVLAVPADAGGNAVQENAVNIADDDVCIRAASWQAWQMVHMAQVRAALQLADVKAPAARTLHGRVAAASPWAVLVPAALALVRTVGFPASSCMLGAASRKTAKAKSDKINKRSITGRAGTSVCEIRAV